MGPASYSDFVSGVDAQRSHRGRADPSSSLLSPKPRRSDDYPPFRTEVALTSLVAIYFCLGVLAIWSTLRDWLGRRGGRRALEAVRRRGLVMLAALVALCVYVGASNTLTLIVEPQMTEFRLLRSQVASLPTGVPRVVFLETDTHGGMTNLVADQFGLPFLGAALGTRAGHRSHTSRGGSANSEVAGPSSRRLPARGQMSSQRTNGSSTCEAFGGFADGDNWTGSWLVAPQL